MSLEIRREDHRSLPAYALVPMSFEVRAIVDVTAMHRGHADVRTRAVSTPWRKNYDTVAGNDPASWSQRFDVRHWIFLGAFDGITRVGAAIVVADPSAVAQLDGRPDSAILWDVRVAEGARRQGVGKALLARAEDEARASGCRELEVETQDINVPACRLYSRVGFALARVVPGAYPDLPDETKLVWSKELVRAPASVTGNVEAEGVTLTPVCARSAVPPHRSDTASPR